MEWYFDEIQKSKPDSERKTMPLVKHVDMFIKAKMNTDGNFNWCIKDLGRVVKNRNGDDIIEYFEEMRVGTYNNPYSYVPSLYINKELVRGVDQGDVAASAVCDCFTT